MMGHLKTGLVLEGGAMRGMFTAGVLDVFMEHGVHFDGVMGVSAGAVFGPNFLSGQIGRVIRYNKRYNGDRDYMGLKPLLSTGNIVNTKYAYGTVPMLFLVSLGLVCFVRYVRTRRAGFAVVYVLAMGAGYAAKQNALIPMLAVLILSVIDAVQARDVKPVVCAVLALLLGAGLGRFAVWQYELRSGMQLGAPISALARLVMGLQESATCAGWFNGYTAPFIDLSVTAGMQKEIASADLAVRLAELSADPGMALAFLRDKYLSQWLEPGYSTLWYGFRCEWLGRFNGVAALLYREDSPVRPVIEGYMNLFQQAMYAMAVVGAAASVKRRGDVAALVLPVTVIGGFLFHMLFEAKSQYIFVYAVYLMPLAGYGLSVTGAWLGRLRRRMRKRS